MKKLSILFFAVIFFSCQNQSEEELILPPDRDEAETLVAKYYSSRNQELNYPFYKGLGLNIMGIKRIPGTDSFLVSARVNGRKWPNPKKDTLTFPFEENKNIRVFRNGVLWQGDSISKK
jgi:hypothetical protein